jgi:hypothetical protein
MRKKCEGPLLDTDGRPVTHWQKSIVLITRLASSYYVYCELSYETTSSC